MSTLHYSASNRIGLAALPWCALFIAALPAAGLGYAFGLLVTPFWFHPVAFAIMLVLACAAIDALARRGRVRHPRFMRAASTLLTFGFLACHWLAYESLARTPDMPATPLLDPLALARMWWSPPEAWRFELLGWELPWLLSIAAWVSEGMLLVWLVREAGASAASQPFCEATFSWCEKHVLERRFAALPDLPELARRVGTDPRRLLRELTPCGSDDPAACARVTVHHSQASCHVTIENLRRTRRGSRVSESTHETLEYLSLPGMDWQELVTWCQHQSSSSARSDPIELVTAIADFQADRFAAALAAASGHRMAEQHHLRCDALRLCGLASGHLGRWEESFGHWQALFLEQEEAAIALQAATCAVMAGHLPTGETWLARARALNCETPDMRDVEMLAAYLAALERTSCFDAGMPYMDEIKAGIALTGITDPDYLRRCGMPPFGMFLSRSAVFVRASLEAAQARAWYEEMQASLDEPGRKTLAAWIEQHLAQVSLAG